MILQCKESGDFKPHPEGIYPAVCVDVIDLGLVATEFQGQTRIVNKLKLVFETEEKTEDGRRCTVSRNFTASLHSKAKLAEFLGKWRGRPVVPGESIDLAKLIGACCTLVISQQQNMVGKTYASIDAVSKPTKKLAPSGQYDATAARQRIEEWKAKQGASVGKDVTTTPQPSAQSGEGARRNAPAQGAHGAQSKSAAAPAAGTAGATQEYDPEIGF